MVEWKATFSVHDAAKQRLIIVEQCFINFENIVATVLYEILNDNIELVTVSQSKAGFLKQFLGFFQR